MPSRRKQEPGSRQPSVQPDGRLGAARMYRTLNGIMSYSAGKSDTLRHLLTHSTFVGLNYPMLLPRALGLLSETSLRPTCGTAASQRARFQAVFGAWSRFW